MLENNKRPSSDLLVLRSLHNDKIYVVTITPFGGKAMELNDFRNYFYTPFFENFYDSKLYERMEWAEETVRMLYF